MTRLSVIAAAALTLVASVPLLCATTAPAAAQGWRDGGGDMGDGDLRDLVMAMIQDRLVMNMIQDRSEDGRGGMREQDGWNDDGVRGRRLRERIAERHGGDDESDGDGSIGGRLRERIAERRGGDDDGDGFMRGRLRERLAERRGGDDESDGDGSLRSRLRERIAERRGGDDGGGCYFLTRSLRNADGSLLVFVRRRVCRD